MNVFLDMSGVHELWPPLQLPVHIATTACSYLNGCDVRQDKNRLVWECASRRR